MKYGTVRAFDFFSGKTENFRQKKRYASRLETASVIKIVTENGRVRYGTLRYGTVRNGTLRYGTLRYATVRYGVVDKIGLPAVK